MRVAYTIILFLLVLVLLLCAFVAHRSQKPIAKSLTRLLLALVPPIIGNLILVFSSNQLLSTVGCYTYFLGMDLVMLALVGFTIDYCNLTPPKGVVPLVFALLAVDALQLIANIFTGHAFGTEEITAFGAPYFRLVPHLGQTFHRVVDYGILGAVLVVMLVKLIRSPRINSERYSVILATMVFTTIWETLYIFSRTPVDRSMMGFGVFGVLVFYLSLYYRPLRLLDRMLATVASEIPDALFFYDMSGRCIWANKRGMELAEIEQNDFDVATERLVDLLGDTGMGDANWSGEHMSGSGDAMKSYVMERRAVTDDKGRTIGSFLTVRDNSAEQITLQREIYNATHDSLTQVYNRAGYDLLLSRLDLSSTLMLLVDGDKFKQINDTYGHEVGDRTLQRIAHTIMRSFRKDDYVCRIGGDEFVVLMPNVDFAQCDRVVGRVAHMNEELASAEDGVPPISLSVGVARGDKAADGAELFEQADVALYDTKRAGGCGLTFAAA
ncbi:MAG: diguanylate cyclase [Coriobacteriales bacterium]|nr:diguanylate cyclase [Coriobacteriales bacterium]